MYTYVFCSGKFVVGRNIVVVLLTQNGCAGYLSLTGYLHLHAALFRMRPLFDNTCLQTVAEQYTVVEHIELFIQRLFLHKYRSFVCTYACIRI